MAKKRNYFEDYTGDPPRNFDDEPFYGYTLDQDQKIAVNEMWNPAKNIIFIDSKAGTGKTFLATAVANLLVKYGMYNEIVYIVSPYGEERQGYLPGDITQKSEVYFEPFYQALVDCGVNPNTSINSDSMVNQKSGTAYITCLTHTYLRGANLKDKKVIIIDESQNFTVAELKKTLTRCGDDCKIFCIGHTLQCDLKDDSKSGFRRYIEHFRGYDNVSVCNLTVNHRGWISSHADELEE
jgi:predicted ribonuclease YlaK